MKRASIVTIGNEILAGQTVNTNAAYLAVELQNIGIPVASSYTVGDNIGAIVRALSLASADSELVLITGGLGPTDDDLTRKALAEFLTVELELQNELLERIQGFFTGRNLQMPVKNNIQAYIPAGAKAIDNHLGTAPGIMAEKDGKLLIALPGVPSEMEQMFETIVPRLQQLSGGQVVVTQRLRCFGAGESTIAGMLGDMMQRDRNPLINCTADSGVITLYITAIEKDKNKAWQLVEKEANILRNKLGDLVFGTEQQTLAKVVAKRLTQQKKTIATAESCTGGLLAKLLTDIPGASKYFVQGWITYSNSAKTDELGVSPDLIEKYGAVSEQVAEAMARGARKKAQTDFAIAITGIAGPGGATEQKPIGLVYISIDSHSGCRTKRYYLSNNRQSIRIRAAQIALNLLRLNRAEYE